ncbi:hypothetical protein JB92DRAFT_3116511 [Gautieria morchelliformis]|nr:hypothetical protein JB92DRAFT_3116511 [Gautieria morchelliformis]
MAYLWLSNPLGAHNSSAHRVRPARRSRLSHSPSEPPSGLSDASTAGLQLTPPAQFDHFKFMQKLLQTTQVKEGELFHEWSARKRVSSETQADRARVLAAFAHMVVGSFKYASIDAPITSFHVPPSITPLLPPPTSALPLAALLFSRPTYLQDYFGFTLPVTHPLLVPAVFLNCAVRLEAARAEMAIFFHKDTAAQQLCLQTGVRVVIRLLTCYIPWMPPMIRRRVFTPGMLKGDSSGTIRLPSGSTAFDLLPILHFFIEYHAHDPSQLLGYNDTSQDFRSEGMFKAWLPQGVVITETERETPISLVSLLALAFFAYPSAWLVLL